MAIYSGIQKKSFLKKLSRLVLSGIVSVGGVLAASDVAWAAEAPEIKTYPLEKNYSIDQTSNSRHPIYSNDIKAYATNVRFGYGYGGSRIFSLIGNGKDTVTVSKDSMGTVLPNILNTNIQDGQSFSTYNVFDITYTDPGYSTRYQYGTRQVFDNATVIGVCSTVPGRGTYLQDGYIDSQGNKVYFLPSDVSGGHVVVDGVSVGAVEGGDTCGGVVNNGDVTTHDNRQGGCWG